MSGELAALRKAIVGVCDGSLGATRTVSTAGTEAAGAGKLNERVKALIAPRFDVVFTGGTRHAASPLGTGTIEIKTYGVRVDVTHALTSEQCQDAARNDTRDAVHEACDELIAALTYPGNLLVDAEDNATGCVSGMLAGEVNGAPTWELVAEDWEARLIRSQIRGTAYVQHTRAVA